MLFDPDAALIDSLAFEPALPTERLSIEWLHERFASNIQWDTEIFHDELLLPATSVLIDASVLLPIIARKEGLFILLTQRTAHLTDHPGQISFPGGRFELQDASPIDTALRETEEEIGLQRTHIDVLGCLPHYITRTGYRVTPVVALVHPPFTLQRDTFEVEEIFEVPLGFLMQGAHYQRRKIIQQGPAQGHYFYAIPYQHHLIWGATAAMLRNLFHFLRA